MGKNIYDFSVCNFLLLCEFKQAKIMSVQKLSLAKYIIVKAK